MAVIDELVASLRLGGEVFLFGPQAQAAHACQTPEAVRPGEIQFGVVFAVLIGLVELTTGILADADRDQGFVLCTAAGTGSTTISSGGRRRDQHGSQEEGDQLQAWHADRP